MDRICITGFGPFPGVAENPTQRVIEHLGAAPAALPGSAQLHLLDVDYRKVVPQLDGLLTIPPRALILTGYSNLAKAVTLESRATGICAPDKPDMAGFVPSEITSELPALNTSIDLQHLQRALSACDIAAEISADAGAYLCNFSYHYALRQVARRQVSTQVLFVHMPAITGSELAKSAATAMELDEIAGAISVIAHNLND